MMVPETSKDWRSPAASEPADAAALELQDVFKIYGEGDVETVALRGAWLTVTRGEFVAIVGPSGSGKSTLLGIGAGLTAPSAGRVLIDGRSLTGMGEDERARLRRRALGIVLQRDNLLPFLNAVENVELTMPGDGAESRRRAGELLERVGLGNRLYHRTGQLSGGEQQRVALAVALANDPVLLLADELTGELDSVTAAGVIDLLRTLNHERGTAIVLVTHNHALAARAQRSVQMRDGLLTAFNPTADDVKHLPQPASTARPAPDEGVVVAVQALNVSKTFPGGVHALRGVSLQARAGESLAIMGPSGCGKSTLLNVLGGLDRPTSGDIMVAGRSLGSLDARELALMRRREIGFVFQAHHLLATLSAAENVALPLIIDGEPEPEREARALELLELVELGDQANKLPDQLSGGQRQRVAIARSLAHRPKLLLADEPTGSLDSESAARIASLLADVAHLQGVALVLVTHDPTVAGRCDRIMFLSDGAEVDPAADHKIVERSGIGPVGS